jgi:hypothetical protein
MTRQLVGVVFCTIAAVLYAARHVGAAMIVSTKTGDQREAYRFALQAGGSELLVLSIIALLIGLVYLAWGEYGGRVRQR